MSVYITDMPIQLKFDMLYIGTEIEMKDYEKKFEEGMWLPFDKVLDDATNRVVLWTPMQVLCFPIQLYYLCIYH